MAKDKPLSFLNHHLKVGNSLIGAKLSELGKYPFSKKEQVQKDLFTQDPDFKSIVQQIIDDYSQIRKENSDSKKNIETKKEHLDEIDRLIKPYKEMCDLHTSIYFGNDIKEDDYDNIITNKLHPKNNYNEKYFHWELEFPEVLLKKNGFDSIIGNPPYIGFRESRKGDSEYLSMVYSKIHLSKGDIYYYFIYKSLINLYPTGYFGFITTRYWMESESGGLLRNFIEKNEFKYKIIDFETYQVFDKVGTATSITILSKNIRLANLYYCYKNGENAQISHQFLKNKIDDNFSKKELRNTVNSKWQFLSQIEFNLFRKIESECITFSDIGDVKQGIVSGCDAAFIYTNEEIQTHNIEKTNLVKYLKIGDLLPFYHDKTRTFYLNYLNHLSSIQEFPNTISFLGQFLDKLIKRRECESGKIKYFHLQWGRSKELFDGPKLITRKISPINCFILDLDFYYSGADTTILVPHNRTNLFNQFFLLGFLNSDLSTFLYQLSAKKMDYRYEYNPGSVMDILVPEKLRDQQFVDSQDVLFRNNHKSDDEYLNIANYAKSLSASEYNSLEYNTLIKNLNLEVCKLFNIEYSLINEFVENKNYRWI